MNCFEALFDLSNQTGCTTEERQRADVHYNVHRQVHVLRTWKRWWLEVCLPSYRFIYINHMPPYVLSYLLAQHCMYRIVRFCVCY